MKFHLAGLGLALLFAGALQAQEVEIQAQLSDPLGTRTSHKGDIISAQILMPDTLKGDTLNGKITEVKSGGKIRGTSSLRFSFETLQHGGQEIPISSDIKSIANSKGQADTDEEGRVIRKSGNTATLAGGALLGGLIGGIAGGAKGAAIGAGAGAAAAIVLIEVAVDGPDIRFDPGSTITLKAKSRSGTPLTNLAANPAAAEPAAAASKQPMASAAPARPAPAESPVAQTAGQPDLKAVKADFVTGEKVLFYDDFTDMAGDEPPPHWKVRGASVALKTAPGIRQLTATDTVHLTPMFTGFPKNFTLETEVKFDNPGDLRSVWSFFIKGGSDEENMRVWTQTHEERLIAKISTQSEELAATEIGVDWNQPVKQALWIQNGRLRFYVNGQRVIDVNQVDLPPLERAELMAEIYGNDTAIGYRMVRIAESAPDFGQIISSTGRYVTHGIHFDTDSDRLLPESAPVIKLIAQGLEKNPNLKLKIEGHTDSTGSADHNLDLSRRRAEAVKAVLVAQFGVNPSRLTTDGLGAAKPIDSNDTPQGRAQNRRVEFVKQ